ncbi:MAG: NAD(P)-binding domain-containing protein [bacterium]|nr:NAD(P)-binding domain-containing protein [bacterium]
MSQILIIGAGKIGCVVAQLLEANKNVSCEFWDKDATKVSQQGDLTELAARADSIFLCINSWVHRDVLEAIKPHLKDDAIVVSLAKGIEKGSNKTLDEVLAEYLPSIRFGLLSGPMLADELSTGKVGAAVIASKSAEVRDRVADHFAQSKLLIQTSDDSTGVALCGVLKNVYAIVLGMCEGLELGCNARGVLVQQILSEMTSIVKARGGNQATVYSYAGIGDIIATGLSPQSNNYSFGKEYAIKGGSERVCEGSASLPSLILLLSGTHDYPLLSALERMLIHETPVHEVFSQFFANKKE